MGWNPINYSLIIFFFYNDKTNFFSVAEGNKGGSEYDEK